MELLIAISFATLILIIGASLIYVSVKGNQVSREQNIALGLLQESHDAINNSAVEAWTNIFNLTKGSTNYFPQISSGKWAIVLGTDSVTLNNVAYSRSFVIQNVCRNTSTKNITGVTDTSGSATTCATSGGSYDPSTELIVMTVSWGTGNSISANAYLTRWRNQICVQTSWASISAGPASCPPTVYQAETNITTGSSLIICAGGC